MISCRRCVIVKPSETFVLHGYPPVNVAIDVDQPPFADHFFRETMASQNFSVYPMVTIQSPLNHHKIPLNPLKSHWFSRSIGPSNPIDPVDHHGETQGVPLLDVRASWLRARSRALRALRTSESLKKGSLAMPCRSHIHYRHCIHCKMYIYIAIHIYIYTSIYI